MISRQQRSDMATFQINSMIKYLRDITDDVFKRKIILRERGRVLWTGNQYLIKKEIRQTISTLLKNEYDWYLIKDG